MSRSKKRSKADLKSELLLRELEAFRLARWDSVLPCDRLIALELEGAAERLYAIRTEEDPGDPHLFILFGEESAARFRDFWLSERWSLFDTVHFFEACSLLTRDVEPQFLRLHQAAGKSLSPSQTIPFIVAKEPGHKHRSLRGEEIRFATAILRLLHAARTSTTLPPVEGMDLEADPPEVLLRLQGDAKGKLQAADHWAAPNELRAPSVVHQVSLPDELADLPRTDRTLSVRTFTPGGVIEGDERLTTFTVTYDGTRDKIVSALVHSGTPINVPIDHWVAILRGEDKGEFTDAPPGLPRAIRFEDSELLDSVSASLALLGIEAELDSDHSDFEMIENFIQGMAEHLSGESGESGDGSPAGPKPGTLEFWKELDLGVIEASVDEGQKINDERTLRRYFGQPEVPQSAVDTFGAEPVVGSYFDWLTHDLRLKPRGRTVLERWISNPSTPHPVKKLLRARRDARVSLFRVTSLDPGVSLDVIDVLSLEEHRVHDRMFSRSAVVDLLIFLRIYQIDEWKFIAIAGPIIPSFTTPEIDQLVDRALEGLGKGERAEALAQIGHLWVPLAAPRPTPKLVNTHGDNLQLQSLRFAVADPTVVEFALEARKDVEREEGSDPPSESEPNEGRSAWVWLESNSKRADPTPGVGTTLLGRIIVGDDFLEIDVNSNKRAGRAKRWLNKIEGVRLLSTTLHELPEPGSRPAPERLPRPAGFAPSEAPETLSEEELREAQEQIVPMIRQQLLDWIDTPIPALEDRTPRQACETESDRQRVTTMIQTMR